MQPVLAITGMQETQLLGTGYQQEVHLEKLFMDVAEYDVMVHVPTQIPTLVDLAVRHALSRRTVSHITFPNDLQIAGGREPVGGGRAGPLAGNRAGLLRGAGRLRAPSDLDRAAAVLNAGSKRRAARRRRRARRARRAARGRRAAGQPDREDAAGQGGGPRRSSA